MSGIDKAQSVGINDVISIQGKTNASVNLMTTALVYLEKVKSGGKASILNKYDKKTIMASCLAMADKYINDCHTHHASFANLVGVDRKTLHFAQIDMLHAIDHKANFTPEDLDGAIGQMKKCFGM